MHIAFVSLGAFGHINPTLSLVTELISRGVRVTYFTTENMRKVIEPTGAKFIPMKSWMAENDKHNEAPKDDEKKEEKPFNPAIYYGVPMIGLPQMDEQAITARQIEKLGLGFAFCDKAEITSEKLKAAIVACLNDPAYKAKLQEFSEDMKSLGGAKASADAVMNFLNK